MVGLNGISAPDRVVDLLERLPIPLTLDGAGWFQGMFQPNPTNLMLVIVVAFALLLFPNMNRLSNRGHVMEKSYAFPKAFMVGALFSLCMIHLLQNKSPQFLYFQF
jgi:hypothetical protein